MIKVAMVNSNGEVDYVISPSDDNAYEDRAIYDEHTAVFVDYTTDDTLLTETKYWNGNWHDKSPRPSEWHDWDTNNWAFSSERFWESVRQIRDMKLVMCDWTQFNDSPLSVSERSQWTTYRQSLREVPSTNTGATSLDDILWPTEP